MTATPTPEDFERAREYAEQISGNQYQYERSPYLFALGRCYAAMAARLEAAERKFEACRAALREIDHRALEGAGVSACVAIETIEEALKPEDRP